MTKLDQPRAIPLPLLLVYGKPTSPDLPQASWFRVEDRGTVATAAHALKFLLLDITGEDERPLLSGIHEGVLKGAGRMIVGSVTTEVYQRIETWVRTRGVKGVAPAAEGAKNVGVLEQNMNNLSETAVGQKDREPTPKSDVAAGLPASSGGPQQPVKDPWDALRVGSHVLGKYWETDGSAYGWWLGIITEVNGNDFTIQWPDEPKSRPLKIERKHVAILHPSFEPKTEWEKKRR